MQEEYNLSHLKELEAESIHIIREVAAEFENPVMLYSIGKDSSVMVRLAEKAFAPGKVPFPLMHIDSKWKFKEMIQFRDEYAKKYGWNLIVESNMEAFKAGVGPFTHGSKVQEEQSAEKQEQPGQKQDDEPKKQEEMEQKNEQNQENPQQAQSNRGYQPIDESKINWKELEEKWGVKRDDLEKSGDLDRRSEERRVGKECRSRWSPYH